MVQTEQITFYTHAYSVYSHRVHLALEEAKADYTLYTVNIWDKPAWYAAKVNPIGKVPAITYGGPKVSPDAPSDASVKLRESLVLLEFLADVFPDAGLLPADAVQRAQARLFMRDADAALYEGMKAYFFAREPAQKLLDALERVQRALPPAGFAAGAQWCIADMAAAPFLARIVFLLEHDLGVYPAGEGAKTLALVRGERFARLNRWFADVQAQPSFKATWDEAVQFSVWSKLPMFKRN
ncbi:glutathione transferase omega [Phanerochaete sordida]|uniref:Glutathione transferase omega n=1 Tax=Phanerochaete sordida TaxID=48140 RepID=A0A9P3LJ88_9APHY|nr:glutathione transferase omega [Phanerochaete sordida]